MFRVIRFMFLYLKEENCVKVQLYMVVVYFGSCPINLCSSFQRFNLIFFLRCEVLRAFREACPCVCEWITDALKVTVSVKCC